MRTNIRGSRALRILQGHNYNRGVILTPKTGSKKKVQNSTLFGVTLSTTFGVKINSGFGVILTQVLELKI